MDRTYDLKLNRLLTMSLIHTTDCEVEHLAPNDKPHIILKHHTSRHGSESTIQYHSVLQVLGMS